MTEPSPFDDSLLATASEDGTVKLWKIPERNKDNITEPLVVLSGHKKRVDCLEFHPTAHHLLATGSSDKSVKIWDLESGTTVLRLYSFRERSDLFGQCPRGCRPFSQLELERESLGHGVQRQEDKDP